MRGYRTTQAEYLRHSIASEFAVIFPPTCPEILKSGSDRGTGPMRNKLISSLAGAAFILAASGFAFAADLNKPVYKGPPPPPPAPVYSWTGWYVGGNVGYGGGSVLMPSL